MIEKRNIQILLEKRLKEQNPLIQVVIGPRQVGKTTAIKEAISGRGLYETADSPVPISYEFIYEWWDKALKTKDKILVIDEVQKIEGWAEVIKKLWNNEKNKLKVILSGSAALTIEKKLKESLAGRYELLPAPHWNFAEANKVFSTPLEQFIEFGCYPGAQRFIDDVDRWAAYIRDSIVELAIGRDIMQLQPVENPALFRQVFLLSTQLPAQIVSLNKLQGLLQDKGAMATIQHYLSLLGSAFLVTGVQKYSPMGFRVKSSPPKIIVHDNALLKAFERPLNQKIINPKLGFYFENIVGARFIEAKWEVYYWKDKTNEVDFIVNGPNGERWAIEVKSSPTTRKELNGLDKFCNNYPDYKPFLISLVNQTFEDIGTLKVEEILSL